MSDQVPLREVIDQRLRDHDRVHEAEHKAVYLASAELARRLDVLNHAHEQAVSDRSAFVTRDRYDADARASEEKRTELAAKLATELEPLKRFRDRAAFVGAGLVVLSALLTAAMMRLIFRL